MTVTASPAKVAVARHSGLVRLTHWLTVVCFVALLVTGAEIIIAHPRFYWGETGNVNMKPWLTIPIPSSRGTVPTGYGFVMPDQNGWSRALHFEAAWLLVITAIVYGIHGFWSGHFRNNLWPERGAYWRKVREYLRPPRRRPEDGGTYNAVQRTAYLLVIFGLFPLVIWTGLALSSGFDSAFPWAVNVLGGRQSARTLHFLATDALVLFLVVHVTMVALSGFRARMRGMITGRVREVEEPS